MFIIDEDTSQPEHHQEQPSGSIDFYISMQENLNLSLRICQNVPNFLKTMANVTDDILCASTRMGQRLSKGVILSIPKEPQP